MKPKNVLDHPNKPIKSKNHLPQKGFENTIFNNLKYKVIEGNV